MSNRFFKPAITLAVGCLGVAFIRSSRRQELNVGKISDQVRQLNDRLNAVTNEIAADLGKVSDALKAANQQLAAANADTTATEEALQTTTDTIAKLEALGADPQNPIPTDGQGAPGPDTNAATGSPVVDPTGGTTDGATNG